MTSERRSGPSTLTLSLGGIVAFATLLGSGIATYIGTQNDISNLKRGEQYQVETNVRLSDEIKALRQENRETAREFNEKLDRLIEQWRGRK